MLIAKFQFMWNYSLKYDAPNDYFKFVPVYCSLSLSPIAYLGIYVKVLDIR